MPLGKAINIQSSHRFLEQTPLENEWLEFQTLAMNRPPIETINLPQLTSSPLQSPPEMYSYPT
jgi:hypothetical protein